MPKRLHPFAVGVDWLQVFCEFREQIPDIGSAGNVHWRRTDFPTAQFLQRIEVYYNNGEYTQKFADVLCLPRLSCLKKNAAQLKILNKWLYTSSWFQILAETMRELRLKYISISRIDLYYDCIKYQNGRKPKQIILDYIDRKVLKIGINRGYIAFNDWGYTIAENTTKPTIEVSKSLPNVNGITWGRKGYIQTQIYNKSLEMREQKHKEWIAAMWENVGLTGEDVWRTEIRIQKTGKDLQLLDSGDLFSLGISEIADTERIYELFLTYADRQMRFVKADYHAKKQQMKPIILFPDHLTTPQYRPKHAYVASGTNRTLSMVKNYLGSISAELGRLQDSWKVRMYAQKLSDAQTTLEWLFQHYEFGEPRPSKSPEIKWLARKLLEEEWQGEILTPKQQRPNLFSHAAH